MPTPRSLARACLALAVLVGTTSASVGTGSAGPIEDKRAEAARIAAQIDAGAVQVTQASKQADRAKGQLGATEAALSQATADAGAADTHLHQTQTRLADQAVDAYVHGGSAGLISALTKSDGSDLAVRKQYASLAAGQDQQAIDDMRAAREDLAARRASLRRIQNVRAAAVSQLNKRAAALNQAQNGEKALLGKVQGELATLVAADQARRDADAAARAKAAAAALAASHVTAAAPHSFNGWPPMPPGWQPLGGTFACIRQMESGDNYSEPGGGAYQFLDSTWHSLGQPGTASDAPPWVQDAMAVALQQRSGWSQWTTAPLCGR
jgi:peptidoglycan hydrolase CwlO-like protein